MITKTYRRNLIGLSFIICLLSFSLTLTSCDDQLDIVPKGQSTLETVNDLEMLLHQEYDLGHPAEDLCAICNESYGMFINVPLTLTQTSTNAYAWLAYDENVNRADLTSEDRRYSNAYKYINYMNTIIEKAPDAMGDDAKRRQIIAEAHVMRAYLHWLLVNIYAKQYDAQTAPTEGGIAYVTATDVFKTKQKQTVAEVYEQILADCADEYINALPLHNDDVLRGDQAWGNAVRAKVLMQMKRYADALPYAQKSIDINGTIEDRSTIVEAGDWIQRKQDTHNLLYMGTMVSPMGEVLSIESSMLFEPGDYVKNYAYMFGMKPGTNWGSGDDEDDDEEAWTSNDDDEGGEGDDDGSMFAAWNFLYGYMNSGVMGALMYYSMSSYITGYGITSDRMYYTAAECYIRTGQIAKGLDLINQVRRFRIDDDNYEPFTAGTEKEAMALLQQAKWIECIATYENFFDCKRWNTESDYRRTITRTFYDEEFNPTTYSLAPDSPLWIFPFPLNAVRYNSTLTQNY